MILVVIIMLLSPSNRPELQQIPDNVIEHLQAGQHIPIFDGKDWIRVFVRSEGPTNGETVVLTHGVPVSSFLYRKMIKHITKAGIRVVTFDFPGLGFSEKPTHLPYTWSYFADRIKDILDG